MHSIASILRYVEQVVPSYRSFPFPGNMTTRYSQRCASEGRHGLSGVSMAGVLLYTAAHIDLGIAMEHTSSYHV